MTHARKPHDHPDFDTAGKAAFDTATAKAQAAANVQHPLPEGVPGTADGLLAFLQAGTFTDAQLDYLRVAMPQFEAGAAQLKGTPDGDKAEAILVLWRAIVAANPAPAGNPFNP